MPEVDANLLAEMYRDVGLGITFDEAGYVDELRSLWDALVTEVAEIKAVGGIVELPSDVPDLTDL